MRFIQTNVLQCLVIVICIGVTTGACTWPLGLENSVWEDGRHGNLTFSSNQMSGWEVVAYSTQQTVYVNVWECHIADVDNTLILISSTSLTLFDASFYGYICLRVTKITEVSYRYYIHNPEQSGYRARFLKSPIITDVAELCSENLSAYNLPAMSEYGVLVKQGHADSAKIDCPYEFLGTYDFTHTAADGTVSCDSSLDVWGTCTDTSEMSFGNTCSTNVAFSVSSTVWCVDTVPVNGDNYVTVYNGNDATSDIDNVIFFRFSCFAISGDGSRASVVPMGCENGQSPDNSASTIGATLTMTTTDDNSTCPPLVPPDGGNVTYSTDGAVTTASYMCNDSFSLAGPQTRTCKSDHTWSDIDPTCTCSLPIAPANGSQTAHPNGTLTYTCDLYFVLVGSVSRTCQSDSNTWSGVAPSCVLCASFINVPGLAMEYNSTGLTTVVNFYCDAGYTIDGALFATCIGTGTWDTSVPSCALCENVTTTDTLKYHIHTDGYTSVLYLSCVQGYVLLGNESRSCNTSGIWDGDMPSCECEDPPVPSNGSIVGNGSIVQFTCDVGFSLLGSSTAQCLDDGTGWSTVTPDCRSCDSLTTIDGGYYNVTTDGSVTMVTYSCDVGYTILGDGNLTCQPNGTWDDAPPTCVECSPAVTTPSSGNVSITTDGTTSMAAYTCADGYNMSGEAISMCQTSGTWTNSPPTCSCVQPLAPTHGSIIPTSNIDEIHFECNVNYSLNGPTIRTCATDGSGWSGTDPTCESCDLLPAVDGGYYTFSTDGLNTKATYFCYLGYTINEYSESTCQSDGTWSSTDTICGTCSELSPPSSGNITLSTDGQTTIGMFTCVNGYELVGTETVTCRKDGVWIPSQSTSCVCVTPSAPDHGFVTVSGDTIMYTCDVGYSVSGETTGNCGQDGTGWNITAPQCVQCEILSNVTSGNISYTSDGLVTEALFQCDVGSSILGSSVLTCNESGTWNFDASECVACPSLPQVSVSTGNVTLESNGTTTIASYACPAGYIVNGEVTITCTNNGTWDFSPSECVCETPITPDGGSYNVSVDGMSVSFSCGEGYSIVGSADISCDTDGTGWTLVTPNCTKCEDLASPSDGDVLLVTNGTQTSAVYTCGLGFTLDGQGQPQCQTDGTWTNQQPTCVSCPSLPNVTISNGNVTLTSDGSTTTAAYSCPQGYEVKGQSILTCTSNGTWDSQASDCVCQVPNTLSGRSFNLSEDGLSVTFSCDEGYTIQGTGDITCDVNGGGWTTVYPNCSKCEDISSPNNGNVTLVTNGTQTSAVFTCGVGFTLDGQGQPQCQTDGTWSDVQPNCVSCPTLPTVSVSTGNVTYTSNGSTTVATYACPSGYEVKGEATLTCTVSGDWDLSPSDCICMTPVTSAGGTYNVSADGLSVTFSCDEGYTMVGTSDISCDTEGTGWEVSYPNCTKCDNLSSPSDGDVLLVTNGTQTSAVYTCGVGFTLEGQGQPQCQSDGTWTSNQPSCAVCPVAIEIDSGNVTLTTDGETTRAEYTCDNGYELEGNAVITCQTNSSWDADAPICYCIIPSAPPFGNIQVSPDRSQVWYTCDTGFILTGVATRTCQHDGLGWTNDAPTCISCSTLIDPSGGSLTMSSNGSVTIATFSCDIGFTLNGTITLVCNQDGSWSSEAPTCTSCPSRNTPSSGLLVLSTDNATTTANYLCSTGYYLIGEGQHTCNAAGEWSNTDPTCVCDSPPAPTNGNVSLSPDLTIAMYTCDLGYSINGVATRTCSDQGFGWSDALPTCVSNTTGGDYIVHTNGTSTSVTFQCEAGASLQGTVNLTCDSVGSWQNTFPTCVTCPDLISPTSGNLSIVTDGWTSMAYYQCAGNYVLVGEAERTCQTTGLWSGTEPMCNCIPPNTPSNGTMTLEDSNNTAIYTCDIYFTLVGTAARICSVEGLGWSENEPVCKQCPVIVSPTNGEVIVSTNSSHTMATYSCDVGTTLDGAAVVTCLPAGSWSSLSPSCVQCGSLRSPSNGNVDVSTDGLTSAGTYSCMDGYVIKRSNDKETVISCLITGEWSILTLPTCVCVTPVPEPHRQQITDGTTIEFTCDVGYSLSGVSVIACGDGGEGWLVELPNCTECDTIPTASENGDVTLKTDGHTTKAVFTCDLGTTMNGSSELTCRHEDGQWQDDNNNNTQPPSCVTCTSLSDPLNGEYTFNSNGLATSVQLNCNEGFESSGWTTVECGTDGIWQYSELSTCEEIQADSTSQSFLTALIAVGATSVVIITILSILLAGFIYLYLQKKGRYYMKYTESSLSDSYSSQKDGRVHHQDNTNFPIPLERMVTSMAPVSYQHHVTHDGRKITNSPAPQSFGTHLNEDDSEFSSPPDTSRSTTSIISLRSGRTQVTKKSLASLSGVHVESPAKTPTMPINSNRLAPIPNHQSLVGKLSKDSANLEPKRTTKVTKLKIDNDNSLLHRPPTPVRCNTPVSHALRVSNSEDKASGLVSAVAD